MSESINELEKNGIVIIASSNLGIKELISKIRQLGDEHTIQIFDPSIIISKEQVIAAYINAYMGSHEGRSISKNISIEMLLSISMRRNIDEAIGIAGAKSSERFVIFFDSKKSFKKASKFLSIISDFKTTKKARESASRKLGLKSAETKEILEKMAASRLYI